MDDFNAYLKFLIQDYKVAKNSVLERLISANQTELEESEVIGNMFILFFAGHETTAGTLHWALLNLARYPDIQQ